MSKDAQTKKQEAEPTTEFSNAPVDAPSITFDDLTQMCNVIDAASQRGAFRGGELAAVGALYDKISKFLKHVQEAQTKAAPKAEKKTADTE